MKKRTLILIIFLMLYITPVIFSTSSTHTGIVAEQFIPSDYGDISNQSVLSIKDTLPADVLFYQDVISSDIYLGTSGDSGFENTTVKDGVYFILLGGGNADINFVFNETTAQIEGFEYAIYGYEVTDDASTKYYQYPGWTSFVAFTVTPAFYNGSVDLAEALHGVSNNYTLTIKLDAGVTADLYVDYVQVQFKYMTLKDENHFGDSFADVSGWSFDVASGTYSFSSDGDIGTLVGECVGAGNDYVRYDQYGLNIPKESYVEFRYRTVDARLRIQFFDGDTEEPTPSYEIYSTDYTTVKFYLGAYVDDDVTGIELQINDLTNTKDSGNIYTYFDYFRISPSNETGWQHDGSTLYGTAEGADGHVSTDGDMLTFTVDSGPNGFTNIMVDPTLTLADVETDYYQFLDVYISNVVDGDGDGNVWQFELHGAAIEDTTPSYEAMTGHHRFNIHASTVGPLEYIRCYTDDPLDSYSVDYFKIHSIANFTLSSGASNTVDDVLYCEDGELYSLTTEGSNRYWILDYDPVLDIGFMYNNYSLDVSANTQWFAEYIGGWEDWKVDEPSGILTKGTVTDFKILIDGTTKLSSILFIETLSWQSLDGVTFYFVIGSLYGSWTIQSLVIFLGLVLIPVSTIYLVHGGRDDISMDKVFYFFIMFIIGWALVIGGIMS